EAREPSEDECDRHENAGRRANGVDDLFHERRYLRWFAAISRMRHLARGEVKDVPAIVVQLARLAPFRKLAFQSVRRAQNAMPQRNNHEAEISKYRHDPEL